MRVFVAGVSSEVQNVRAVNSFNEIRLAPGDERAFLAGRPGAAARVELCQEFQRRGEFDAIFLADMDMLHPRSILEGLRAHDLDIVSGHYFKRQTSPMQSICQISLDGTWPYIPLLDVPDYGIMEIATTGMGNVLIKREVIEAVADDMPDNSHPFEIGTVPWLADDAGAFGSDFRFFAWARKLGYKVWLDCSIESLHGTTVWLGRDLYRKLKHKRENTDHLKRVAVLSARLHGMNANSLKARIEQLKIERAKLAHKHSEMGNKLMVIEGQIAENEMYLQNIIEPQVEGRPVKKVVNLPVFGSKEKAAEALDNRKKGPGGMEDVDLAEARQDGYQREAMEFVEALQDDPPN